jgi:D-beta-D-heptose 7-phosphate kinase/D-beta-D-heptose 1-phosphate adenosyltransferase
MKPEESATSIEQLVASFRDCRVLVLGDAIVDEYLSGDVSRLSPEAPVPVLHVSGTRRTPGGAANTAANVSALGGTALLVAAIGSDTAGSELATMLRGANVAFAPVVDSRPTLRKTRVVSQQHQIVRLDYEDARAIDDATERRVLEAVERHVRDCHILAISDYAKGLLTRTLCEEVIALARIHKKEILIDPRPQHRDWYGGADFITPNWKEALGLLGRPDTAATADEIRDVGTALAQRYQAHILLTLGPHGMSFFSREGHEPFAEPTVAREVFDVSGAGDTVAAAFALARGAGAGYRDAVSVANRAAGVVVGKFGTATVSPAELLGHDDTGRLLPRAALAAASAVLRANGKRIVTVNGSFDLLHPGHLHILREAKRQGDVLVVGLNSDQSVRGYKGADRPIVPETVRAEMLLALRYVDFVHVFDEADPIAFIEAVRPDVHVNGAEYGETCVEASTVRRLHARLHLVERIAGHSTSDLVAAIATSGSSHAK